MKNSKKDSILKISNLNAGYDSVQILHDVNIDVYPETITTLMGPNGAGKSTLLKSIFNLTDVISGEITYNNESITNMATHQLLKHGISYVPQGKVNFDTLTVERNLLMGAYRLKDKHTIKDNLIRVYDEFPVLEKKKNEYAFSLSGGQQQMLAMGRALMNTPKLLLLDEPSLGLSPKLVKELFEHIMDIKTNFQTTVLIVEHNLKSALSISDYGIVLVGGEVKAIQPSQDLIKSDIIRQVFVGSFD